MGAIADTAQEQKRQVLAAGATAGTAGVQAFDQAQQAIEAQRATAVQRAHDLSRVIGVTAEQNASLDALMGTPLDRAATSIAGAKSMYQANQAAADASNAAYFDKITAIEPLVQAQIDAARAAGGGGGGSGSGGDPEPSGLDALTDAQLGKYLMNQAVSRRQGELGQVQAQRDDLTAQADAVRKSRRQNRRVLRKKGRLGRVALRNPQKIERRLERVQGRLKRVEGQFDRRPGGGMVAGDQDLIERRQRLQQRVQRLDKVAELSRRQAELRSLSKRLGGEIVGLDEQYRGLIPTGGGRPLSQDAKWIAGEEGLDPVLVEALVGPTQDAQYGRALAYDQRQASPNLYADAAALRARPADIDKLEKSEAWQAIDSNVQNLAASGASKEEFRQALQATAVDRKAAKKFRVTQPELQLAVRLALRRYEYLFPTLNELQRIAEAQGTEF